MNEKQPHLKIARPAGPAATDPTKTAGTAETPRQKHQPATTEPEPLAFDPYKFSRIVISPELRKEMSHAKLPRLAPEILQDTLPPNQALAAAAHSEAGTATGNAEEAPAAPADVVDESTRTAEPHSVPALDLAKADGAETAAVPWADSRRRRATIGVLIALSLMLAVGVLARFGRQKDPVLRGELNTIQENTPAPRQATVRDSPRPVLGPSAEPPKLPAAASSPSSTTSAPSGVRAPHVRQSPLPKKLTPALASPPSSSSGAQGSKASGSTKTDGPDFEQPFNPQ